ncbi:secreted repeat-containing protein [Kordia sp. SMS9]|nr:secreted repeat-containing protein [Kordia sp. SMS9]
MTFMLILQSCSSDDGEAYADPQTNASSVQLSDNTALGTILTDADGKTLYFFSKDTKDTSQCLGGCLDAWPIFYTQNITTSTGLEVSDFATITRADGELQTTYKGWPLHYFANDNEAGDTNGEDIGNVWYVAKPDYSLMYAKAQLVGHDGNNYMSTYALGDEETSYIVSVNGRTIYTFSNDKNNTNNFTSADFSNNAVWPIVEITLDQIPSILQNSDFGTIDVNGRTQLTYRGWPLYYFGEDAARGDNKGVSFPAPGVWPIANVNIEIAPN